MDAPEQVKPIIVLLIDDDELIRQSIATYLDDSGFDILQADNGRAGMQMIHQTTPDVVLLDLRMPELDGLEVLDQIKQEDPELPVIVVTGAGVLKDAVEALRMGAFDFISKPIIDMAFLENAINKAVERTRMRHEIRCYREHLEAEISKRTGELEQRSAELERSNRQLQSEMIEKRRTQKALSRSESRLADIIAVFEGFIYTVNRSYELQFVNPKLMAYSEPAKPGANCHLSLYGISAPCAWCPLERVLQGHTVRTEFESLHDGRWYYGVYSPQANISESTEGCQAVIIDIHDRKQAEETLRQQEVLLRAQNTRLRSSLCGNFRFGDIIGKSTIMHGVYRTILKAAESNANVIIYGESGTGKELVAKSIHALSDRGSKPFVPVNCGAIPENLIESEFFGYQKGAFTGANQEKAGFLSAADGGTLFLDEVGEINANMQIKLLRAIDGGGFSPLGSNQIVKPDIRIIAATNRDLADKIHQGHFRSDFFYRIHVIPINLPSLRERREDIPLLIHHFLQLFGDDSKLQSIPETTMQAMQRYDWPGNVRELQNAVRQFIALQEMDVISNLPLHPPAGAIFEKAVVQEIGNGHSLSEAVQRFERRYLEHLLTEHKWHRSKVAAILGVDRRTLFRKIKMLGLE
jgi:DNA-binding NtrC family response regulator